MATPSTASYNKKSPTIKRILREAAELTSTPSPSYAAHPLDSNLFEWHFTVRGPPSTPYSSGIYHGRISLPPTYPLRPPSFRFLTPSGRFEVNREICLSISGHHEDTWQPAWGVRTAVVALRAFMEGEAGGQVGGLECGVEVRRRMAEESVGWRCAECGKSNEEILEESAEAAREAGLDAEGGKDEKVPEEMKFGFKKPVESVEETAPLATTGQTPTPTGQTPTPTLQETVRAQPVRQTAIAQPLPRQEQDENFWLDRAIYALIALLCAIVLKRMLGVHVL